MVPELDQPLPENMRTDHQNRQVTPLSVLDIGVPFRQVRSVVAYLSGK